ncbi:hypothetical protein [Amycolatopsis sp. NPDC058986]|uniref:hypothetical protein n=1 Tax=unclassified Amycolatopsis TaxID=2618356 RepID=UPI00366CDF7A
MVIEQDEEAWLDSCTPIRPFRPLWRLSGWAARACHRLSSVRPWMVLVRHGITAHEARRGWAGAAMFLMSTIHSWVTFMLMAGGTLALDALLGRAYPVWILLLETLLIVVFVPWLAIFISKPVTRRSTPYRLMQRIEGAVVALNPTRSHVRVTHGRHWDTWYLMSRVRARRRRRLITLAWQISGDLALLCGRSRRHRGEVKGFGTWLLWAAEDIDDVGRRDIVTRRCVAVVQHVIRPDPWLELAMKQAPGEILLVRPRFGDRFTAIAGMSIPIVIGPLATVVGALVAALVK